jgi:hypothetical protein
MDFPALPPDKLEDKSNDQSIDILSIIYYINGFIMIYPP